MPPCMPFRMGTMAVKVIWPSPQDVEKLVSRIAGFLFAVLVIISLLTGTGASLSQFNFILAPERDSELAARGTTTTRTLVRNYLGDQTRKLQCAGFCNLDRNCTAFSYIATAAGFTCKFGNVKWNDTQKLTGSKVFFKIHSEDYTTILDPFRYKRFDYQATSPADASRFCYSTDGSAVPVGYPSSEALKTLQLVIPFFLPKNSGIFVGVQLANVSANGTWEFRTLRDWPVFVDPLKEDPSQPWAPNEPAKLPYSQPSDIGVMVNSDGEWFTVDTRSATSYATLCMKHTVYEFVNVTGRFHRVDKQSSVQWTEADRICRSEGGYLSRAYGQQGKDFISYVKTVKGASSFWMAGNTGVAGITTLWKFPDGLVLDDSMRLVDSRQIWARAGLVTDANMEFCIREEDNLWWGRWCIDQKGYVCEGGF